MSRSAPLRRFTWVRSLLTAGLLLAPSALASPPAVPEYELKAELIRRFTLFVEWPEPALARPSFVIGVIGDSPMLRALELAVAERRIKGLPVAVRRVVGLDEVDRCHILFIGDGATADLSRLLRRTRHLPILTVGETAGSGERGVLINFFIADNQIRYEINAAAVQSSGLDVRAQLYRLGRVVGEERPR